MTRKSAPQPEPQSEPQIEALPTQFRNVSPLGALDVPAIGHIIQTQEVFEVREDVAALLIHQPEHFAPADGEPLGLPDTDDEGDD